MLPREVRRIINITMPLMSFSCALALKEKMRAAAISKVSIRNRMPGRSMES